MDSRPFKIATIKARIKFCEAERCHLLELLTSSQVDLAWISVRMDSVQQDLRFLHRDLEALEKLASNEWSRLA